MSSRILLTSTEVAKIAGISVHCFHANKKIFDENNYLKTILNHRARPSRKKKGVFKPYWFLNNIYYGKNIPDRWGGNNIRWYSDKIEELFKTIGIYALPI